MGIPAKALEQHIAILGKTGSGKTYAAKGVVERILSDGGRVCIIDPTGAWHGLRSSATGKSAGFPVVIFGGEHADLPLGSAHGEALAEIIGTASTPAIIDTSLMRVGERTRFFADFADALVRKNKGPLHLIIDEAHLFAPQGKVNDPQSGAMLHAANNLVSLGRSRGLRIILITQRPAKLHKDSLTQVETLVALRLIAPQDRKAVEEWIKDNADEKKGREIISSLATLKTGQGWVWAPELNVLERITFPKIKTFDSSRAPEGGENGKGPVFAPIDQEAIAKRLENVAKDALANDPGRLKKEIAELRRTIAAKPTVPVIDPKAIEVAEERGFERAKNQLTAAAERQVREAHLNIIEVLRERLAPLGVLLDDEIKRARAAKVELAKAVQFAPAPAAPRPVAVRQQPMRQPVADADGRPLGAERKPLAVLASVYPAGMTEAQWAVASGLKRTGGTWSAYVSRLRSGGRIQEQGDLFFVTDSGMADIGTGAVHMPPAGPELVEFWAQRISGVGPMLRKLAEIYPEWISRDDLAADLTMAANGGTFQAYISRLRSPGLIEVDRDKNLRASPMLMEGIAA
jgi:hypothetical protein